MELECSDPECACVFTFTRSEATWISVMYSTDAYATCPGCGEQNTVDLAAAYAKTGCSEPLLTIIDASELGVAALRLPPKRKKNWLERFLSPHAQEL